MGRHGHDRPALRRLLTRAALIVGASGFAGRALAFELGREGYAVTGVGRGPQPEGWSSGWERADVRDRDAVASAAAVAAPDAVFHLVSARDGTLPELLELNVCGLANVLDAVALTSPAASVVVVGSSAEYGAGGVAPLTEVGSLSPVSAYGVTKAAQGLLALQRAAADGLRVTHARTFNLVGPGLSDSLAPGAFARSLAEIESGLREPVVRTGPLGATRDYLDVRDAARAWRLLAERRAFGAVNVCSGRGTTVRDLLGVLIECTFVDVTVEEAPPAGGRNDVPAQVGDPALLRRTTGWEQLVPLRQSLADLLTSWRERVAQTL